MKSPAARITLAAVIACLICLLAVPIAAFADDAQDPGAVVTDVALSVETSPSADVAESDDASAPFDATEPIAAEADSESDALAAAVPASAPVQCTSQSSADTRSAIEALLKARKRQFDKVTAELKRTIDRLATDIRIEDAQGGNVAAEKAQLVRARAALTRAYALERAATAKYRAVASATDQRAQYEKAKLAARTSTAQLLVVTKLLRNLVPAARLVACLQPLRSGVDSA
jgi:hypothetical protein